MPRDTQEARILVNAIRRAWQDHLDATDGKLTEDNAEDFLVSAQDALRTLADELRAQLRLGVAEVRLGTRKGMSRREQDSVDHHDRVRQSQ